MLAELYDGDLRKLADASGDDADRTGELLQEIPGIGPVGAQIFLREAQQVWPWLRPYVHDKVADAARSLDLPYSRRGIAGLVGGSDLARLSAALVRVSLSDELRAEITGAAA